MPNDPLENLVQTFCDFGLASGGQIEEYPHYLLCQGSLSHPIANFAVCRTPNSNDAIHLARHAASRTSFQLYAVDALPTPEILERAGFQRSYRLVHLAADPIPVVDRTGGPSVLEAPPREPAVDLMVQCFFTRYSPSERQAIRSALIRSDVPIYGIQELGRWVAVAFAPVTEHQMGVYNLCVLPEFRGRGLGRQFVSALRMKAEDRTVALQSDINLQNWYRQLGFSPQLTLSVYTFNPRNRANLL